MGFTLPSFLIDIPRSPVTALGLPLLLGVLSGSPTARLVKGPWFNSLAVPPGRPPRQVFPIVWPALYLSMGYASYLAIGALETSVLPATKEDIHLGLALYYGSLVLNFAWSPLFFMKKEVGVAFVDSVLLTGTATYMATLWHGPTEGKSTYFLAPYCAWLGFATYLNGGIWVLNRGKPQPPPSDNY